MMKKEKQIKDIAASVRARLLNIARGAGRNFDAVLLQYFQERFLYRLSISPFKKQFILKGALVFLTDSMSRFRPTKDIDLAGRFHTANLKKIMCDILVIPCEDGVQFNVDQIAIEDIAVESEYQGFRVKVPVQLGVARKKLQIDIGFGDVVYPKPVIREFPGLLDLPTPRILIYPKETIIAEKFEAIIRFNRLTSRMKDFYDILLLAQSNDFQSDVLRTAITKTFKNRNTNLKTRNIIFQQAFKEDKLKQHQWRSFLTRNSIAFDKNFSEAVQLLEAFIEPMLNDVEITINKVWQSQSWSWSGSIE
jgi:predicted nucleotidyltransferase component of viral defense system